MHPLVQQYGYCPACNATWLFYSSQSHLKVCTQCNTLVARHESDGTLRKVDLPVRIGAVGGIPDVGWKGMLNGRSFEVLGVVHMSTELFETHVLTLLYSDTAETVLLQCLRGGYYLLERSLRVTPSHLPVIEKAIVGEERFPIADGTAQQVSEAARIKALAFQGEVVFDLLSWVDYSYTLTDTSGGQLVVWLQRSGLFRAYEVLPVAGGAFSWSVGGWTESAPREVYCTGCRAVIHYHGAAFAQVVVCDKCSRVHGVHAIQELVTLNQQLNEVNPIAQPGTVFTFEGACYTLMGCVDKSEYGAPEIRWREYCLYSPEFGFRFLSEYNGHWIWIQEVTTGLLWPGHLNEIIVDGEYFYLFHQYSFNWHGATGAWPVVEKKPSGRLREYVHHTTVYIAELNDKRYLRWYRGVHIDALQVAEGFKNAVQLPPVIGVGAVQPLAYAVNIAWMSRLASFWVLLLLVLQTVISVHSTNRKLLNESFYTPDSVTVSVVRSPSFKVGPGQQNIECRFSAPVVNSWFELEGELIHEGQGKSISFSKGVEWYNGYSNGEHWTEGSQSETIFFSSVPPGTYHFNFMPVYGSSTTQKIFEFEAVADVPMWRNFFIVTLLLLLYPLVAWWRHRNFEKQRWESSVFNPYQTET